MKKAVGVHDRGEGVGGAASSQLGIRPTRGLPPGFAPVPWVGKFERLMPVFRRYTAEHIKVTILLEHRSTMGHCPVDPWG